MENSNVNWKDRSIDIRQEFLADGEKLKALILDDYEQQTQETFEAVCREITDNMNAFKHLIVSFNDLEESESVQINTISDHEGYDYVPVFTDEEECRKGAPGDLKSLPIGTIIEKVLEISGLEGVIINPHGIRIVIRKPILWRIIKLLDPDIDDLFWKNDMLDKAIHLVTDRYRRCFRKGIKMPYITHPLEVLQILISMRADSDLLIASVLHDLMEEDPYMTEDYIIWEFGHDACELITKLSADIDLSWAENKQCVIDYIQTANVREKLLLLADVVSELRNIEWNLWHGNVNIYDNLGVPKEKLSWYYCEIQMALSELRSYDNSVRVYIEMENLYKDIFVTFFYDEEHQRIFQAHLHGACDAMDKTTDIYTPWHEPIPEKVVRIGRMYAEFIEESWRTKLEWEEQTNPLS